MISNPAIQTVLSVVFIATFGYSLLRLIRAAMLRDRIGYGLHAIMSAAMFAMIWPWGVNLLLTPQMIVFSAGTLWFLALLITRRAPAHEVDTLTSHHDGARTLAYHAAMMAAMVLMAAGMTTMGTGSGTGTGGSMVGMGSMAGMDMSNSSTGGMMMPPWVTITSAIAAIAFAIAAFYYLGSTLAAATAGDRIQRTGKIRTGNAAWNLLMAAGMAALFLPMTGV